MSQIYVWLSRASQNLEKFQIEINKSKITDVDSKC